MKSKIPIKKKCEWCGKDFIAYNVTTRFCCIEKMFNEAKPYQKRYKKEGTSITEFYKTSEILQKYGISESVLYKIAKCENFPKVFQRGKSYWSKKHIDTYFAKKAVDASITEWYSVADMKEKFNMTTTAVYTFVSNFKIPKKRINPNRLLENFAYILS